jgi:acetamidase/formamidase
MPGDVLEVRILDINLILDWGYNRQRAYTGALPEEFTGVWTRIIPLNRATKAAEVAKVWSGLHTDLDEGMKIAVRETIDLITKRFPHLTREEAYMIASVAVDYHVTQVVDGTEGVHGMDPEVDLHGAALVTLGME